MERRLTRQGRARKAELLRHAADLFAERGYEETRVIDIVRAAGVAKGLFYWYFDNKEALFRNLITDTRRRLRRVQADAVAGIESPLAQLHAATRASVGFMSEHRHLYALMQIEGRAATAFTDEVRATSAVHAADTAALIAAGQRAGEIRTDDTPATLAHGLLATVLHMVYFHRTGRLDMPVDELAASVARLVTRGLAADNDAARRAEQPVHAAPAAAAGSA